MKFCTLVATVLAAVLAASTSGEAASSNTNTSEGASTNNLRTTANGKSVVKLKANLVLVPELMQYAEFFQTKVSGQVECNVIANQMGVYQDIKCNTYIHQENNFSPIIAAHIHRAPPGTTGANGNGPPVVNQCGGKTNPIQDGSMYSTPCTQVGPNFVAQQTRVKGVFVKATNGSLSFEELLKDIVTNPHMYYFNVHQQNTFEFWSAMDKGPLGLTRGQLMLA